MNTACGFEESLLHCDYYKRQHAVKPIIEYDDVESWIAICPNCDKEIWAINKYENYCVFCGQKLYWREK